MIVYDTNFFQHKCEAAKEWLAIWIEQQDACRKVIDNYDQTGILWYSKSIPLPSFEEWWKQHPRYFHWTRREVDHATEPMKTKLRNAITLLPPAPIKVLPDNTFEPVPVEMPEQVTAYMDIIFFHTQAMYEQMGIKITRDVNIVI